MKKFSKYLFLFWMGVNSVFVTGQESESASTVASNAVPKVVVLPSAPEFWMPGLRGRILSGDGFVLAATTQISVLGLKWVPLEGDEKILSWAHEHLKWAEDLTGKKLSHADKDLLQSYKLRRFQPFILADLTEQQRARFESEKLDQKDFVLLQIPRRVYPQESLFAHGVGYVKRCQYRGSGEFKEGEVFYDRYDGGFGLEKAFDKELVGKDGRMVISTEGDGFFARQSVISPPKMGPNVRTTINAKIQNIVEESMKSVRIGAAVILEVDNGDVVSMVSRPNFDPNHFLPYISPELWKKMSTDSGVPLFNRSYAALHPPGSIFKVITSIASMRAGVLDPDKVVDCNGIFKVGDVTYKFPAETNSVNFHDALTISCNTYFMGLGLKTGKDQLIATAREMGVGQKTGIELLNEPMGRMPDPDFVKKTHRRTMGSGDIANTSIGQGDVLVTPLQAANWMVAIANGGKLFKPRLVSQVEDEKGVLIKGFPNEVIRQVSFTSEQLRLLKECLQDVVEDGTGYPAKVPGMQIAAKTGTAQVGTKEKPRQVVWMNGYVPAESPKYAFAIMIEGSASEDLHGGDHAGPIAGEIFSRVFASAAKAEAVDPDEKKKSDD